MKNKILFLLLIGLWESIPFIGFASHDVAKEATCTTLETSPNAGLYISVIRDDSFGIRLASIMRTSKGSLQAHYIKTFLVSKFIESNTKNGAGFYSADNFGMKIDYLPDYTFTSDGHLKILLDSVQIDEKVTCQRR